MYVRWGTTVVSLKPGGDFCRLLPQLPVPAVLPLTLLPHRCLLHELLLDPWTPRPPSPVPSGEKYCLWVERATAKRQKLSSQPPYRRHLNLDLGDPRGKRQPRGLWDSSFGSLGFICPSWERKMPILKQKI